MNKYNKFLLLGMISILSMNALAAPLVQHDAYNRVEQHIVQLKESGVVPKNIGVNFKFVSEKQITEQRLKAEALLNISQETCDVTLNVTQDMRVGFSGSTENRDFFKSITAAQNDAQEQLRTEYVTMHEASHCKLYEIKDVFQSGNSQVDNLLNQYYKFSGTSYEQSDNGNSSIYYMLHENFADTHAFMQMLKEHGPSQDLIKTMQQVQIERSEAAAQHNPGGMIVHNTEFALKELLKENNIAKVMSLQSNQEIQDFALQIANKGVMQTLSNNDSAQVVNTESLENGAMTLLGNVMRKDILGTTAESNISINWEGNNLLDIASAVYKDFKTTHDVSGLKTEAQFAEFYKNNSEGLKEQIIKSVDTRLSTSYSSGVNVLETINHQINTVSKTPNLNIEQIKQQGIENLKQSDTMVAKFVSKEALLIKIAKIRAASSVPTVSSTLKYNQR